LPFSPPPRVRHTADLCSLLFPLPPLEITRPVWPTLPDDGAMLTLYIFPRPVVSPVRSYRRKLPRGCGMFIFYSLGFFLPPRQLFPTPLHCTGSVELPPLHLTRPPPPPPPPRNANVLSARNSSSFPPLLPPSDMSSGGNGIPVIAPYPAPGKRPLMVLWRKKGGEPKLRLKRTL